MASGRQRKAKHAKNGKRYDINAIETEMKKEGAGLFLFTSDGALPYLVRNQGGKLMISDEPISSQHLLPEREDNQIQRFEARPSLQISDTVMKCLTKHLTK